MYQFCFQIGGERHCFDIPLLLNPSSIHPPPPNNFPPFELAASVLLLVDAVPPSALSAELSSVAHRFIARVAEALPDGVELVTAGRAELANSVR